MRCLALIPARLASGRLPNKPLADVGGLPLVERVRRAADRARGVDRVVVATPDDAVARAVRAHGGEVLVTGAAENGTARVAAALAALGDPAELVLNVQGDMPLLDPDHVDAVVSLLRVGAEVATLMTPLVGNPADPHLVKVHTASDGRALGFSRAPLPAAGPYHRHIGLYGFRRAALLRCAALAPSDGERRERLEQLRWLDAGIAITVGAVDRAAQPVDTAQQLAICNDLLAREYSAT